MNESDADWCVPGCWTFRLNGLHSAKLLLLWSFGFADVADLQQSGDWDGATALMINAAKRFEAGGAEALVICTNTMHRMASALEAAVDLPLIHIADATADRMKTVGATRPCPAGDPFHHGAGLLHRPPARPTRD